MTYLFQDLHSVFISSFDSPEMYIYHADKYYQVRNALSHQASTVITDKDAKESIYFMKKDAKLSMPSISGFVLPLN